MARARESISYNSDTIERSWAVDFTDASFEKKLMTEFKINKLAGKIRSDFDDDVWILHNPMENDKRLRLAFDENKYHKFMGNRIPIAAFRKYLRLYVMHIFGLDFDTICGRISGLIRDIEESDFYNDNIKFSSSESLFKDRKRSFQDFIELLPIEYEKEYVLVKTEVVDPERNLAAETLCEFTTYFILLYEIEEFWEKELEEKERMYYFPLYLIWMLDSILPQRPEELCATPYDCIEYKKGRPWFMRKYSIIKGYYTGHKVYHDERDYEEEQIPISEELAREILRFREFRSKYSNDGFLFSTELLRDCHPKDTYNYADKFTPDHLCQIRNQFYMNYLEKVRGYEVIRKEDFDEGDIEDVTVPYKRIMKVQNRDARHIAIISLLRNGCSVRAAMRITHHADASTLLHYGNNIEQFEKAYVFFLFNRAYERGELVQQQEYISKPPMSYVTASLFAKGLRSPGIDMGNCMCYSMNKYEGRNTDCYIAAKKYFLDPCLVCDCSELKEQEKKDIRNQVQIYQKKCLSDYAKIIAISEDDDKTLEDIRELINTFNWAMDIQRSMEIKERLNGKE